MKKVFLMLVVLTIMVAGLQTTANAAWILGGQLYATGGDIEVEVIPSDADYVSELWLYSPTTQFIALNTADGSTETITGIAAGHELIFGVYVQDTDQTYYMGPGSRNPDGMVHAAVEYLGGDAANVGFEDIFGGGDEDYNDAMFYYISGVTPNPEVPDAPSMLLAVTGLATVGGAMLRRRK